MPKFTEMDFGKNLTGKKKKNYITLKSVYLASKLLFKQVLLKTMEHRLLFLILFFQDSSLFF